MYMRTRDTMPMITFIALFILIGLPAIAFAFNATRRLRPGHQMPFASASVSAIPAGQLAPESAGYTEQPIEHLLAAAEKLMRTHPAHIEYRRQEQIKQENERKARQAASAARKQAATQQQAAYHKPRLILLNHQTRSPTCLPKNQQKKAAKPKPAWEDIEALRKKRENLPPLPAPTGCALNLLTANAPSPKLDSAIPVQQQANRPQTLHPARLNLFQRSITILKLTAKRCQAVVQQTTRLAQSIPCIFRFLAPRFWQKSTPSPPNAENPR
jgi:hypothetical protein